MNSMKDVYHAMLEQDQVKVAQVQAETRLGANLSNVDQELVKQAQDYDHIGRVMAHHAFADMVKEALDEEMAGEPEEKKKEALDAILAKAKGEKKDEDEDEDEDEEEEDEEEEKKASVQRAILEKMAADPDYAAYLVGKYLEG